MNQSSIVRCVCENVVEYSFGLEHDVYALPSKVMIRMVTKLRKEKQTLIDAFIKGINMNSIEDELPRRLNTMFGGTANISKWSDVVFIFGIVSTISEKYKNVRYYIEKLSDTITSYLEQPQMRDWFKRNGDWYTFCILNYTREDIDLDLIELINYLGYCMILQLPIG